MTKEQKTARMRVYRAAHREELQAYQKAYDAANWERFRNKRVARLYGLSQSAFDAMFEKQGGRCKICHKIFDSKKGVVDHDHVVGHVRGLLCRKCNLMLGYAQDCVLVLRSAIDYLRQANSWREKDMPEKLRQMSSEQAQLDSLDGVQNVN